MKTSTLLKTFSCALALVSPASAQVLMLDFGPTVVTGASRVNSPYHTVTPSFTGSNWNQVQTADIASGLVYADGAAATGVSINMGNSGTGSTIINLSNTPTGNSALGSQVNVGVYASPSVGMDGVFSGSTGQNVAVGLEVGGLAAGTYEIYMLSRNTNTSVANSLNVYVGKAAASGNFDFSSGFSTINLSYIATSSGVGNAQTAAWIGTGVNTNYAKFTITLAAGDVLQLASAGGTSETRGFLNSVQIVTVPEPSAMVLLGAVGSFFAIGVRRRRNIGTPTGTAGLRRCDRIRQVGAEMCS